MHRKLHHLEEILAGRCGGIRAGLLRLTGPFAQKPIESALEDVSGGVLIDHILALGAARIGRNQRPLDGGRRQTLIP